MLHHLHVIITSGNLDPYRWELTYWVVGTTPYTSGWIAFQPKMSAGTGISIASNVISADIATAVDSSSTNTQSVGAKLFYDTCGDIETLINAL